MKKLVLILTVVFMVVLSFGPAFAGTFKHNGAQIQFTAPDTWKVSESNEVFTIEAKGETAADNISMEFEVVNADDLEKTMVEAEKQITEWAEKQFGKEKGKLKEEGKPTELTINGMKAISMLMTCDDGKFAVEVTLIVTPANKFMALYYYATVEAEKKHAKEIGEVVNSIKPIEEEKK